MFVCCARMREKSRSMKISGFFPKPISMFSGKPVDMFSLKYSVDMVLLNVIYITNYLPSQFSFLNVLNHVWHLSAKLNKD